MGPKPFWRLLVDIRSVVGRKYWLYLGLVALTGLMEGISVASVVPLLAALGLGSTDPHSNGMLSRVAFALVDRLGLQPTIPSLGMVVVLALLLSSVLFLSQAYLGASLQTTYVYVWQRRLVSGIFGARWGYFLKHRQGDLVNALVTETQRLGGAFYQAGLLVTGVVHGVIFAVIAAVLSGATTLFVMVGGAVLFVLTRPVIQRAYRVGTGISRENAALQSAAGELIAGAKLVKATATELEARRVIEGIADRLRQHFQVNAFDIQAVKAVFDFGAAAMVASILIVNHAWLKSDPATTLVVLAIFVRLMPKLTGVQQSLQSLTTSLSAVQFLNEKVQALADLATFTNQGFQFVQMGLEACQFFGYVNANGKGSGFRQGAVLRGFGRYPACGQGHGFAPFFDKAQPLLFYHLRHQGHSLRCQATQLADMV